MSKYNYRKNYSSFLNKTNDDYDCEYDSNFYLDEPSFSLKRNISYANINKSRNNNNNSMIVFNTPNKEFFNYFLEKNFEFHGSHRETINKDGSRNFETTYSFIPKYQQRKIVDIKEETKYEKEKDFEVKTVTRSYKTGLIFKKTHYYDTQTIRPFTRNVKYKRTVTYYNDGIINYGEWRRC